MTPPIDHLLNLWLENELSAHEAVELERRLRNDPGARQAYYELVTLDHLLESSAGPASEIRCPAPTLQENAPMRSRRARLLRRSLAAAALVMLGLFLALHFTALQPAFENRVRILASHDARLTIAQRPRSGSWGPDEVLRLERGACEVHLGPHVTARFDGPTAAERLGADPALRLLEGRGSFTIDPAGAGFRLLVPGGEVRVTGTRFAAEVFVNGDSEIQVNEGTVVLVSGGPAGGVALSGGQAAHLDVEGGIRPVAHDPRRFLSHLPDDRLLFLDHFDSPDGTTLSEHMPRKGMGWDVFHERNPTLLNDGILDTSHGERLLRARLLPHDPEPASGVYVFTFRMRSPESMQDKVRRQDGFESITLLDPDQQALLSLEAKAVNGHRWYLHDERTGLSSRISHVGALWNHTVTLCYGWDGRATLHDGDTAQAPIIADLGIAHPGAVDSILFTNQTGGDLALDSIEATLISQAIEIP